jgi:hypothetical protein
MRANDADQGLLSDVFSFTLLQEFAARQLGVPVGTYSHYAGSMHIADGNLPRIRQALAEARDAGRAGPLFGFPVMPEDASWADLETVKVQEELLRTGERGHTPETIAATGLAPLAAGPAAVRSPPAGQAHRRSRRRRHRGRPGSQLPVAAAPPLAQPGLAAREESGSPRQVWRP